MKKIGKIKEFIVYPFEFFGKAYFKYEWVKKIFSSIMVSAIVVWGFIFNGLYETSILIIICIGLIIYYAIMRFINN